MATTQTLTNGGPNQGAPQSLTTVLKAFEDLPAFPDDVPTAPLLQISLSKLLSSDTTEINRFVRACEDLGFFYLELSDCEAGRRILNEAEDLFGVGTELFNLPLEEKQSYDFSEQKSYFGYKGQGAAVVDKHGTLDRNEFYNVSSDLDGVDLDSRRF